MSVKVAFMSLTGCWGCHQSFLNAHLRLLDLLPELEIVYWPAVVDYKLDSLKARENNEIDIGFVEGAVRTENDLELLKLIRDKCKFISTFGTCACQGGVFSMANNYTIDECINRKFREVESITNENSRIPSKNVPKFREIVKGIDDFIKIDAYFVGCPPRSESMVSNILYLLGRTPFPRRDVPYCNECILNNLNCLLELGSLCFGPITSSGCSKQCTKNNMPCVGCQGPSNVVGERYEKLKETCENFENVDTVDKVTLYKYLSLFLEFPILGTFFHVGPKLPDMIPEIEIIGNNIVKFLRYKRFPKNLRLSVDFIPLSSVCDTCDRIRGRMTMTRVKRDYEEIPNKEDCFIEQGYVCLGPRTNAGCGGLCMKVNAPCTGCFAPIDYGVKYGRYREDAWAENVIKEFNVALTKEELLTQIKDHIGTFEKFSMGKNPFYKEGYSGKLTGQWWIETNDLHSL